MKKIALLTPSRDGRAHLDHSESVAAARLEAARRGVPLVRYVGKGSSNLPRNRNLLAAQALKDGADILFWWDCDIAASVSDFFTLCDSTCDIVGALPQARSHQYNEPARIAGVGVERNPDETGFHKALSIPTAFMAVKRSVFEQMTERGVARKFKSIGGHESLNEHLHNWFFYHLRPSDDNADELEDDAEDYYFCRKWREMGGEIHAAPSMRIHHYEGLVRHSLCLQDVWNAQDRKAA